MEAISWTFFLVNINKEKRRKSHIFNEDNQFMNTKAYNVFMPILTFFK